MQEGGRAQIDVPRIRAMHSTICSCLFLCVGGAQHKDKPKLLFLTGARLRERVDALDTMSTASRWRDIRAGGYVWRVADEIHDSVEWLLAPERFVGNDANLLKAPVPGSGSRVVRIPVPEGDLVLKEFRPTNTKELLKVFVRGPRAMRSLRSALVLEQQRIAAVRPVAAGYRAGQPWHSFLVTRAISPLTMLREYARRSAEQRRHAIQSLAEIMGRLHASNLLHGDAHQANFVVQSAATPVVIMVDVDGIRACGNISLEMAARDIARLLDYTEPTPREAMRFAVMYCRIRQNAITPRILLSAMEQAYRNRARSGRPVLDTLMIGGLKWTIRKASQAEVFPTCATVEQRLKETEQFLKNSRNVTVARAVGASGRGLIIRRMSYGKLRHRLKDFFRQSRARRAFFRGLLLEQADVPTPRMLAVAEVRRFRWPVAAYTISEEVPRAQMLWAWVRGGCKDSRKVVTRLADAIARLHNRGFVHRDLKASNVLLDEHLMPWLIDMDGVRSVGEVSIREAVRDLVILAGVLKNDPGQLRWLGLRFLKRYAGQRRLSEADAAILWQQWPAK
jgi:tRNA A-37 threonylcarbamoyl transferase component Bud32